MKSREGFSLIEVVVALVLLAVVVLGLQGMAASMITTSSRANDDILVAQLAEDRIDLIRMDPQYDSLSARYGVTETNIPGWPGYTRLTQIVQRRDSTATGITNWLKITVTVTSSRLASPFTRSVTIGEP